MHERSGSLKLAAMVLLVIASTVGLAVLTVVGLDKAPHVVIPVLVALLVWGLFRTYSGLMRQAERAYLESKQAREHRHVLPGEEDGTPPAASGRDPPSD